MSFLLRAALVIGFLSYLALLRRDGTPPVQPPSPSAGVALGETMDRLTTGGIGALVGALPPETRDGVARAGAEVLARHLVDTGTPPRPSGDTLSVNDRQPIWRGPAAR